MKKSEKNKGSRKSDSDEKSKSKKGDLSSINTECTLKMQQRFVPNKTPFKKTMPLKNVPPNAFEKCLREKIECCCSLVSFSDPNTGELRDAKQNSLIDIVYHVMKLNGPIPDYLYVDIARLFGCNIFRTIAPFHPIVDTAVEEDDYQLLDSWPHMQLVYEALLKLLEKNDFAPKKAKKNFDATFLMNTLELFDSGDPRERDYLKTILHRIYGKMVGLRSFIRKQISNIFYTFIYETHRHNGIGELLEIFGSIINGFQLPLKEEHKNFLKHVLIPLHKPITLPSYHPQLSYCIIEFIKKDSELIKVVIVDGLIKIWPKTHSVKELMFLNELEECLELCNTTQFSVIVTPLCKQLSRCITTPNFQVCERTLYLWYNPLIINLFCASIKEVLRLTFPALYSSKNHWNKAIHSMVFNALKVMMEIDPIAFNEYTNKFKEERLSEGEKLRNNSDFWQQVTVKAKENPLHRNYSESLSISIPITNVKNEHMDKSIKNITSEIHKHTTVETNKKQNIKNVNLIKNTETKISSSSKDYIYKN